MQLSAAPRADPDVVSRFATCCRALGLSVHDRKRPADLAAARSGFAALTHTAHDQCDAWAGLAAAGDASSRVIESVWRTSDTAGALQRQIELAPGALGFSYDTGLYLQFRATDPDDFQLTYAATRSKASDHAAADRLVGELIDKRPGWLQARWLRVAVCYRTERWSDVMRLLTPIVTDESLDEVFAHATRVTLGLALAWLGMFAPALSYLEEPAGPVAVAAVDGALAKALSLRAQGEDDDANDLLQELYAANPENPDIEKALSDTTFGLVTTTAARIEARSNPWDPSTEPSEGRVRRPRSLARAIVRAADLGARVINILAVTRRPANKTVEQTELGAALRYAVVQKDAVVVTDPVRPDDPRNWAGVTAVTIPSWWQPYVLSVGSLATGGQPSAFTMSGPWLGIAAPGENIVSVSNGRRRTGQRPSQRPAGATSNQRHQLRCAVRVGGCGVGAQQVSRTDRRSGSAPHFGDRKRRRGRPRIWSVPAASTRSPRSTPSILCLWTDWFSLSRT